MYNIKLLIFISICQMKLNSKDADMRIKFMNEYL